MIPQLFMEKRFILDGLLTSCSFDYLSRDFRSRVIYVIMFVFGFLIPGSIIAVLNILIWRTIRANFAKKYHKLHLNGKQIIIYASNYYINSLDQSSRVNESSNENTKKSESFIKIDKKFKNENDVILLKRVIPKYDRYGYRRNALLSARLKKKKSAEFYVKREERVVKTISFCILMFFLTWLPYAIVTGWSQYGDNIEKYITPYTTAIPAIFAKLSHISNPIIYTLLNKNCREFFKNFFINKEIKKRSIGSFI